MYAAGRRPAAVQRRAAPVRRRPDVSDECVEVRGGETVPLTDRVWWVLAINPFVVLADATPTIYDEYGNLVDLFGQIKLGIRSAQQPPRARGRRLVGSVRRTEPASAALGSKYQTTRHRARYRIDDAELVRRTRRADPLAVGLMLWGAARTRTPSRILRPAAASHEARGADRRSDTVGIRASERQGEAHARNRHRRSPVGRRGQGQSH